MTNIVWFLTFLTLFSTLESVDISQYESTYYNALGSLQNLLNDPELLRSAFERDKSQCFIHVLEYLGGISQKELWALRMLDATAKIPDGIFKLNHDFLGQYDECLAVRPKKNQFQGQYSLLKGEIHLSGNQSIDAVPSKLPLVFFFGLCIPSTCSPEQLTNAFSFVGNLTDGLITLEAEERNTFTDDYPPLRPGDWAVVCLLIFLLALVIISTTFEVRQLFYLKNGKPQPVLSAFSVYKNGISLFKKTKAAEQLGCIHGLRVFSMVWVILFHVLQTLPVGPVTNVLDVFQAKQSSEYVPIQRGYYAVDTFLVISGLLLARSFFSVMKRTGSHDALLSSIHRYFRLTPSYAIVLLFHVTLSLYLGSGPMYNILQNEQQRNCKKWWWTSMLYVQNYVNPDELCLTQTWYLSLDMQIHWISPLILYPMVFFSQTIGIVFIGLLSLIFTFLPFTIAYINGFAPSPDMDTTGKQNRLEYYPSHTRLTPWLVGIALGYIMHIIKEKRLKIKLKSWHVIIGWLLTTAVCLACVLGLIAFENSNYSKFESAFYLTFSRLGWALGIAWIIFASFYGYGGPINGFLSWTPFEPLGKLSYGVYLCHVSVIMFRLGVLRTTVYFNLLETVFIFFQIFLVSHFIAVVLFLLVEAPFFNLERHLLRNAKLLPFRKKTQKMENKSKA